MRHPGRLLLSRSYWTARTVRVRGRERQLRKAAEPPIVVHQMGKVGSSSVAAALRDADTTRPVLQVHHLRAESIAAEEAVYKSSFSSRRRIDGHLIDSIALRRALDRDRFPGPPAVVTMVREPIGQRLSSFFQSLAFRMPELDQRLRVDDIETLTDDVLDQFHGPGWWHEERIEAFFHREFQPTWDIDVFTVPFDRQRGWQHYDAPASATLLRFEDLRSAAPIALAEIIGAPVELPTVQDSSTKTYAALMGAVRERLELSGSYLDRTYGSDAVRHFYSDEELEAARALWSTRP